MHQLTEYSKQMRGLESRATTPSVATKEMKPKLRRSRLYQPKQKKRYTGRPKKPRRAVLLAFDGTAFVDTFPIWRPTTAQGFIKALRRDAY